MRISHWSSDVCSSDLLQRVDGDEAQFGQVDRILNEAVAVGQARKAGEEIVAQVVVADAGPDREGAARKGGRSEEHTSELQSLMRISYAVFCLKKKMTTIYMKHNNISKSKHREYHM